MDVPRNIIVNIGMDRLLQEIVGVALSNYGWRTFDTKTYQRESTHGAEILLVVASGTAEAVINRLRYARTQFPKGKIVLLGANGTDSDIVRFIEEGAMAQVSSNGSLADFVDILQMVQNNRTSCSGRITHLVLETIRRRSAGHDAGLQGRLTSREEEILGLIREGLSNKEIADRLCITPNTVKNHVHRMLGKLKVGSRHQAAWQNCPDVNSNSWPTLRTGTND